MRFFRKRDKTTLDEKKSSRIFKKPVTKTPNTNGFVKASTKDNPLQSTKKSNDLKKFGFKQHALPKELDPSVTFGNTLSTSTKNVEERPSIPNLKKENSSVNSSLNYVRAKNQSTLPNFTNATKKYGQQSSLTFSLSSDDDSIKGYKQNVKSKSKAKEPVNVHRQPLKSLYKQHKKPQMSSDVTSSSNSSLSSSNPIGYTKNPSQIPKNSRPPPNPWQTNSSPHKTPQPKIHRNIAGESSSSISSSSFSSSLLETRHSKLKYPKAAFAKPQSIEKSQLISNSQPKDNLLHLAKQTKKFSPNKSSSNSSISSSQSSEKIRRKVPETLVTKKPLSLDLMKEYTLKTFERNVTKSSSQQQSRINQASESSRFSSDSSIDVIKNSQPLKEKEITQKIKAFKSSSSSISFSSTFSSSQTFRKENNEKKEVKKHPVTLPSVSVKRNALLMPSVASRPMNIGNAGNNMVTLQPNKKENTTRKTIIVKKTEWIPQKQPMTDDLVSNTKQLEHFLYDTSSDSASFQTNTLALPKKNFESPKQDNTKSSVAELKNLPQSIERINMIEQRQLTPEKKNFVKNETFQNLVETLKSSSISSLSDSSNDSVDEKVYLKEKEVERKNKGISTKKKPLRKNLKNRLSIKNTKNVIDTSSETKSLQKAIESMMKETLQKSEKQSTNDDLKKDLRTLLQDQLEYFEKRSQETQSQHIDTVIKQTRKELKNFVKNNMISSNEKQKPCYSEQNITNASHEEMLIMEKALKRFHEDQKQVMHDFFQTKSMLWETQLEHLKNTLLERNNTLRQEVTNSMKECMLSLAHEPKEAREKLYYERFQEKTQYYEKQLDLLHKSFVEELRNSKKESDQLYQSTVAQMRQLLDRKDVKLGKYKKILEHLLDVNQIVRKRVDRMELNKRSLVQKLKESYIDQERFTLALKQCVPLDTTLQMAGHGLLKGQALQKLAHIVTQWYRQSFLFVFINLKINVHIQKPYALYQKPIYKTLTGLHRNLLTNPTRNLQNVSNLSWVPMCSVLLEKQASSILTRVDYLSNSIKIKHQIWVFSRFRIIIKLHRARVAQRTSIQHFAYYLNNFVSFVVFRNKCHVFIALTRILCVSLDPHVPPHYAKAFTLKYDEKDYFKWLPKTDALNQKKQGKWIQTTTQLPHHYIVADKLSSNKTPKLLSYKPFVYDIPLELPKTIPLLYDAHKNIKMDVS